MVFWCCGIPFWCCGTNEHDQDYGYDSPGSYKASQSSHDRSVTSRGGRISRSTAPSRRFQKIEDEFESLEEVQDALRKAGLESSDMILGIDLTKSNETSGRNSFNGFNLHSTETETNPYLTAISIICRTLQAFDDDQLIPVYGFGEILSRHRGLISFAPGDQPLRTFDSIFKAYRDLIPRLQLSGPTNFAPLINRAISIVRENHGRYHILVIIADGQVSPGGCMEETRQAIVEAAHYPLSIIMVGVGDGPWHAMEQFDDGLEDRPFDNFQFVNFTALAEQASRQQFTTAQWESNFAIRALMEVPQQYSHIASTGMLGTVPARPPPPRVHVHDPPVGFPSAPGTSALAQ